MKLTNLKLKQFHAHASLCWGTDTLFEFRE